MFRGLQDHGCFILGMFIGFWTPLPLAGWFNQRFEFESGNFGRFLARAGEGLAPSLERLSNFPKARRSA
jgi:Zn-dependent protease with chaperone function